MKRVALTTILTALCTALSAALVTLMGADSGFFLLVFVYSIGNAFIPILIVVLLYQLIKKKFPVGDSAKRLFIHMMLLLALQIMGVLVWVSFDVIYNFTIENWLEDYHRDFEGFLPITFVIAVAIPAIDVLLKKRLTAKG